MGRLFQPLLFLLADPGGYMFSTPEGVRVHRDGWVVTEDGRAFRAEALMDRMFPQFTRNESE